MTIELGEDEQRCSCGQGVTWVDRNGVLLYGSHASRHGIIWLRNNETYIRPAHWLQNRRSRHLGTFPTLRQAKDALTRALFRAQH